MTKPFVLMPATNLRILELLHTYRFLTPKQFLRLGVTTHEKSLQRALQRFATRGKCVDFADFGVLPLKGRLPRVYFLTSRGAEYLAEYWGMDLAAIDYPKGGLLYIEDYFHRTAMVDFEIELRLFLERKGAAVDFFRRYFDTVGANRSADPADRLQRSTKVPLGDSFFNPDGIFGCSAPDGSRFLYALEVYNGHDTGRVHHQLEKHARALWEGRISELYRHPAAHQLLCLFEDAAALQAVKQRLCTDARFSPAVLGQFAFSTLPELRADFLRGWHFCVPERTCIFDPHPA